MCVCVCVCVCTQNNTASSPCLSSLASLLNAFTGSRLPSMLVVPATPIHAGCFSFFLFFEPKKCFSLYTAVWAVPTVCTAFPLLPSPAWLSLGFHGQIVSCPPTFSVFLPSLVSPLGPEIFCLPLCMSPFSHPVTEPGTEQTLGGFHSFVHFSSPHEQDQRGHTERWLSVAV